MLNGKKKLRGWAVFFGRRAGRAAALLAGFCLVFPAAVPAAPLDRDKNFSSNSARDGGTEAYIENNTFGTNREGGPAFWTDPETGDRRFGTPDLPKQEEPERIEILPILPEVHPEVPPPKRPIVVPPQGGSGG